MLIRFASLVLSAMLALFAAVTGTAHAETRTPGAFHAVEARGTLDVDIRIDRATRVEVTADADVLGKVQTEVRNGTLVIATPDDLRGDHHIRVTVTTPDLDALALSGTGRITATELAARSLAVAAGGAGEIELRGRTESVALQLGGTARVRARELVAKSAVVSLDGTGDIELTASASVTVSLAGAGTIDVYGHPKAVTKAISGVGQVRLR